MVFINNLISMLSKNENIPYVFGAYLGLCLLIVILRVIVCVGYQTHFGLFRLNAKPLNARADLEKARFGLLKNIIADYIRVAEKNTSGVHLTAIVRKYILRLSFIGWSYDSIERCVLGFEPMLPIAGFTLAVIFSGYENYNVMFGVASVGVFAVLRLFAGLFDFQLVSARLSAELEEYVEREVGQFYAGDFGTILLRFKSEITAALKNQADTLGKVITNLEENLSGALRLTMKELSSELTGIGAVLDKPLREWAAVLSSASSAQAKNNESMLKFEGVSNQLKLAAGELDGVLKTHVKSLSSELAKVSGHIDLLALSGKEMKESSDGYKQSLSVLEEHIKYIEKNQSALQDALGHYESSLQSITQKMGDGFGSIVDYHMAGAYQSLNSSLQNNINKITAANQELTSRLAALFEQLAEQSRSETGAIVNMNDQMNLRFEALDNKLL
jgi:prefoldin subunit 5